MLTRFSDWSGFPALGFRDFPRSSTALDELRREMDRLFFDFERAPQVREGRGVPRVSLRDDGTAFVLHVDVPGVTEKDVDLTVTGNTVTLRAERKLATPEGFSVHRSERRGFQFARAFELPVKVNAERVEATLKNGVLTVKLPKAEESQPKQISVKVG